MCELVAERSHNITAQPTSPGDFHSRPHHHDEEGAGGGEAAAAAILKTTA